MHRINRYAFEQLGKVVYIKGLQDQVEESPHLIAPTDEDIEI